MTHKVLLVATLQSHIGQFHKPLMKLLKDNGWEIHVAARDNLAEKNGLRLEYPDRVFDIPFQRSPINIKNIDAYRQLKQVLSENHYDVIHCNTPVGGFLGRLAGRKYRKTGTKVFYTAHGFHFYRGAPKQNWLIYYPIEKWLAHYTDKLVTITEEDYQRAKHDFICEVYRIHGVGVDEERFFPVSEEEKLKLKQKMGYSGPVILNIGELLPNKNHKMAINMMNWVKKFFPDAILVIAGNGPEDKNLKSFAKEIGLEDHIHFIGYYPEIEEFQHIADVLVSCSFREGLPLNVVEAMLAGTPVVATSNRGHRELIEDGKSGILVKTDNVLSMAENVIELLINSELYKKISAAARQRGHLYSSEVVKKELSEIYEL